MSSTNPPGAPLPQTSSVAPGAGLKMRHLGILNPRTWFVRGPAELVPERAGRTSKFDRFLDLGIYAALIVLFIFFSQASPYFLTERNLVNVGAAVAVTGILAAGMTIALVAGQLDLTVGANVGIVSVVVALGVSTWHVGTVPAVILGLLTGVIIGVVNTILVVKVHINSIIATLAFSIVLRGAALIFTNGQVKPLIDPTLQNFVSYQVLTIPVSVLILIVIYILGWIMLTFTRSGWHIYSTGGNPSASQRAGIKIGRVYFGVFIVTGVLAAVGGVITAGNAGSGGPAYANGAEFDVLTAVLLGGIGLAGGSGRIQRTLAGVLVIGILNNGLTLLSVNTYYQQLARGAVFVLAVVLAAISEQRRSR
jgi:ribose transport system permease protein